MSALKATTSARASLKPVASAVPPAVTSSSRPARAPQATGGNAKSAAAAAAAAGRRQLLAGGLAAALGAVLGAPGASRAAEPVPTVYFGNGCFWGRQHDFYETERMLGRTDEEVSSIVGYAGGTATGPDNKVCYYLGDPRTVYEKLGHAEVVQLQLSEQPDAAAKEFRAFAKTYFADFRELKGGRMQRLDPQDAGPGYRNVIGLPGGVNSPLMDILKQENVHGMDLQPGQGNAYKDGKPSEDDLLNVVWIVDSNARPFYRAEQYHQFHNGLGKLFPFSYTIQLKNKVAQAGKIDPTGCLEVPF